MASGWYKKGLEAILNGDVDFLVDDIRFVAVDTAAYTVNLSTDDFLADIAVGARIATSAALAGKSTTLGVFDATDHTIATVAGASFEAVVFYKHTGVDATAILLVYVDQGTGLPYTPNNGNIDFVFDNGANKIAAL